MPGSLITIGRSGAAAASAALELTAQNIANADNPDYSRRTLGQSELVGNARVGLYSGTTYGGVRIGDVQRAQDELAQSQARRTSSNLAGADAELAGLRRSETALEDSRLFEGLVDFEASLTRLASDPLDPALRTSALETARQLANRFQVADASLADGRSLVQVEVQTGVDEFNRQVASLTRINSELNATPVNTAGQAALFDQRDAALRALSDQAGIDVEFGDRGVVNVRLGDASGPSVVSGGTSATLGASFAADGTASFALDGTATTISNGGLAGQAGALVAQADLQNQLDNLAAQTITRSNNAQASGSAPDGSTGLPLFSGTDAASISLALSSGDQIATAPAGAPAGSRDISNLTALIGAIGADDGPIRGTDTLLLGLSSRIAGQETTREALFTIAESADAVLTFATGVDLDTEAANLVRLQQAFQANSRVIQVANELFDSVLALR